MKTRDVIMRMLEKPEHFVDEDKKCWMVKELQTELLLDIREQLIALNEQVATLPTHQQIEIHGQNIYSQLSSMAERMMR